MPNSSRLSLTGMFRSSSRHLANESQESQASSSSNSPRTPASLRPSFGSTDTLTPRQSGSRSPATSSSVLAPRSPLPEQPSLYKRLLESTVSKIEVHRKEEAELIEDLSKRKQELLQKIDTCLREIELIKSNYELKGGSQRAFVNFEKVIKNLKNRTTLQGVDHLLTIYGLEEWIASAKLYAREVVGPLLVITSSIDGFSEETGKLRNIKLNYAVTMPKKVQENVLGIGTASMIKEDIPRNSSKSVSDDIFKFSDKNTEFQVNLERSYSNRKDDLLPLRNEYIKIQESYELQLEKKPAFSAQKLEKNVNINSNVFETFEECIDPSIQNENQESSDVTLRFVERYVDSSDASSDLSVDLHNHDKQPWLPNKKALFDALTKIDPIGAEAVDLIQDVLDNNPLNESNTSLLFNSKVAALATSGPKAVRDLQDGLVDQKILSAILDLDQKETFREIDEQELANNVKSILNKITEPFNELKSYDAKSIRRKLLVYGCANKQEADLFLEAMHVISKGHKLLRENCKNINANEKINKKIEKLPVLVGAWCFEFLDKAQQLKEISDSQSKSILGGEFKGHLLRNALMKLEKVDLDLALGYHTAIRDIEALFKKSVLEPTEMEPLFDPVDRSLPLGYQTFDVAFSFAGMVRSHVKEIYDAILEKNPGLGIFYDFDHDRREGLANVTDLKGNLESVYRDQSKLVVVVVNKDYVNRMWCSIEYAQFSNFLFDQHEDSRRILLIKTDDVNLRDIGIMNISGFIAKESAEMTAERGALNAHDLAGIICERLAELKKYPIDPNSLQRREKLLRESSKRLRNQLTVRGLSVSPMHKEITGFSTLTKAPNDYLAIALLQHAKKDYFRTFGDEVTLIKNAYENEHANAWDEGSFQIESKEFQWLVNFVQDKFVSKPFYLKKQNPTVVFLESTQDKLVPSLSLKGNLEDIVIVANHQSLYFEAVENLSKIKTGKLLSDIFEENLKTNENVSNKVLEKFLDTHYRKYKDLQKSFKKWLMDNNLEKVDESTDFNNIQHSLINALLRTFREEDESDSDLKDLALMILRSGRNGALGTGFSRFYRNNSALIPLLDVRSELQYLDDPASVKTRSAGSLRALIEHIASNNWRPSPQKHSTTPPGEASSPLRPKVAFLEPVPGHAQPFLRNTLDLWGDSNDIRLIANGFSAFHAVSIANAQGSIKDTIEALLKSNKTFIDAPDLSNVAESGVVGLDFTRQAFIRDLIQILLVLWASFQLKLKSDPESSQDRSADRSKRAK